MPFECDVNTENVQLRRGRIVSNLQTTTTCYVQLTARTGKTTCDEGTSLLKSCPYK